MTVLYSLRGRLIAAMIFVFVFGYFASIGTYSLQVHKIVSQIRGRTLQAQARELLAALQIEADGRAQLNLSTAWQQAYADPSTQYAYTLYDEALHPISVSPNLKSPLPLITPPSDGQFSPIEFSGVGSDQRAILASLAPQKHILVIARDVSQHDTLADSLFEENTEHLVILVPFALLALALIWAISAWSLRPIARASREAGGIGPATPSVRISADGLPREIKPLVDAVNDALDRLAQAYATERRLTADAAHELRTPLAVLSLRLQRARDNGVFDWLAIHGDLGQMTRLVEQLTDLARKESLARQQDAPIAPLLNLSRAVRQAAAQIVPLVEAQERQLEVEAPDNMPFRGHIDDLVDLVRNLLDNALIHGSGTISVSLRRMIEAQQLILEVTDQGHGVPHGSEEEVFERFHRLDTRAPGTGLGLAIVRQVARTHGGDVRFEQGRARVVVTLPDNIDAIDAVGGLV